MQAGTHYGILAAARNADVKIFAGGLYGYPYDLISQPEFHSLADLKGQKIVTGTLGSIVTIIFQDTMRRNGLSPSDYLLIVVPGSGVRFLALKSAQVAAAVAMAPPLNFSAVDAGMKVLLHYNDHIKNLQYISYFTSSKYAASNPGLINRFEAAVAQSQRWLNDSQNGNEAARILSRHLKIDEALANRTYRYLVREGKAYRGEAKVDGPGLAEMTRMLAEAKLISPKQVWQSFVLGLR